VLQVINASPGDLAPVFDAILVKAQQICGFARATLQIWDGDQLRAVALQDMPEEFANFLRRGYRPRPDGGMRRVLDGERFVHIADITEIDNPMVPARRLGGARTFLAVPLRKEGVVLGVITAGREEVRPFTEKQIALLQNFAAQAVIAMENARLLGELRQRTDEVAELNRGLEARVAEQVDELGRVGRSGSWHRSLPN